MIKLLASAICALALTAASATTKEDVADCIARHDEVKRHTATANGQLWHLYDVGRLTFRQYSAAHNRNTNETFDYLWRITRHSHIGTALDCKKEADDAMWLIDNNMEQFTQ